MPEIEQFTSALDGKSAICEKIDREGVDPGHAAA
jgi:hypothetical protein